MQKCCIVSKLYLLETEHLHDESIAFVEVVQLNYNTKEKMKTKHATYV